MQESHKTQPRGPLSTQAPTQLRGKPGASANFDTLVIVGERIFLTTDADSYDNEIFQEFTTDITHFMTPQPCKTREEFDLVRKQFAEQRANKTDILFVILKKESGEFLGCCGIHAGKDSRVPHVGLWIKKGAHGHGYGREAIRTLVQYASENLVVEGFMYPVDRRNMPSRKIPESLGGSIVDEIKVMSMSGRELDEVVYHIPPQ
jgi:ribosomal-protein-alanine N-acetyltransferase